MKNRVIMKVALIVIMAVLIVLTFENLVYAANANNFNFKNFDTQKADTTITTPVTNVAGAILSVVRIVGTGVSIIILTIVGIKYMIAAPSERADYKKAAMQYVIGAVIVFGASNILGILIPAINQVLK